MQASPMLGNCSAAKSQPRGNRFNTELLLKDWKAVVLDPRNGLRKGFSLGSGAPPGTGALPNLTSFLSPPTF